MIGFAGSELSLDPELSLGERMYIRVLGAPINGLRIRLRRVLPATRGNFRRILDAGCGRGVFTMELAKLHPGADVLGVDIDGKAIERNRRIAERAGLGNCRFELRDVTDLRFEEPFDLVVSVDNLEHIRDDESAMRSLARAMAPGGVLVVHVPGYYRRWIAFGRRVNFDVPGHIRPGYTAEQIRDKLARCGFTDLKTSYTYGLIETLTNNLSYLVSGAEQRNKHLYAAVFPFLLGLSYLGSFSSPEWGAGVLVTGRRSGAGE